MKKQTQSISETPLWPDGISNKFIKPPLIGLPVTNSTNFKFVKATKTLAKIINTAPKSTFH